MAAALRGAIGSLLLCLGLAACADSPPDDGKLSEAELPLAFLLADMNSDQILTAAEWDRRVDLLFHAFDEDENGLLEVAELKRQFDRLDENGDGSIGPEEAATIAERGDLDGDGLVSRDEYAAYNWDLSAIDGDGDGRLNLSEFRVAQRPTFVRFDQDRDQLLRPDDIDEPTRFTILRF